ncbi:MAG: glycosyltransferase family 4 protein [Candidatus Bathyarchaeia archaeon]
MKVAMLCRYPVNEPPTDGALRYALGLSRALAGIEGLDLHIITLGHRARIERIGRCTVHVVPRRGYPLEIALFSVFPLLRKVLEIKPDIVHCIGTTQPYGLPALYLARRHGLKGVVSTLGIVQVEARYWFSSPFYLFHRIWFAWIERQIFRSFPIIVLSEGVSKRISKWARGSIYVIPPGIDEDFFNIDRNPAEVEKELILCISVIEPRKGLIDLLKAISLVQRRYSKVRLIHIGKITSMRYYQQLQTYIQHQNLSGKVSFLGEVDQVEIFLKKAYLLVLPSYEESFGLAVAEAMAAGVPVVATRVGGLQNLVEDGHSGLLAEAGVPEDLAEKMEKLLANPVLASQMAEEGRKRALLFRWPKIASQTHDVYKRILSGEV